MSNLCQIGYAPATKQSRCLCRLRSQTRLVDLAGPGMRVAKNKRPLSQEELAVQTKRKRCQIGCARSMLTRMCLHFRNRGSPNLPPERHRFLARTWWMSTLSLNGYKKPRKHHRC